MAKIARESGVYALEFEGDRYDLGSKFGFLKANIVKGLTHPETKDSLREFIKEIAKEL
jgi:UTP--glucose-1-phosphate uridylyltransferase